jgi:endonuclease III
MPRGITPRQPSRSGRHDKVVSSATRAKARIAKSSPGTKTTVSKMPIAKPAKASQKSRKAAIASKGYNPLAPERISEILERLDQRYPTATCALHHNSAWELLVATILSAQCTDVRVNMVTPKLFEKYPTPEAFAALQPEELEDDIRSTGFFRNKSKSLVGAARKIISDFGGDVPRTMDELLRIPGVARKTANVVLGTWYNIADGVVVDTHVQRISRRLELTRNEDPRKIEQDLMKVIPRDKWIIFAHQIILHGRALCIARNPKCVDCPLENLCHAADKTWSTVDIHKAAKL